MCASAKLFFQELVVNPIEYFPIMRFLNTNGLKTCVNISSLICFTNTADSRLEKTENDSTLPNIPAYLLLAVSSNIQKDPSHIATK